MSDPPRILLVTPGDPLSADTFSGISLALTSALERQGMLAGAVDGRPGYISTADKAREFSLHRERWIQRYNAGASVLSAPIRQAMSRTSARRAAARAGGADTLLQLTGWYVPGRPRPGMLRCSYHDGNLARFLERPDLQIDRGARGVRLALAYERELYDSIDLIFCMSDALRDSFIEDFGQPPEKVITVGAGANVAVPEHACERDLSRPRFLFVGKQFERKGGPTVVRAFAHVREAHPGAELVIVGPVGLSLDDPGVTVLGRISRAEPGGAERIERLYADATTFVTPSIYEPLGVAVLEAMAHRLPCIASTGGALPELIAEGETGYLVQAGDHDALAERMLALADDPELTRRLGEAGYRRFKERFTWDAVAGKMLAAIEGARAASTRT